MNKHHFYWLVSCIIITTYRGREQEIRSGGLVGAGHLRGYGPLAQRHPDDGRHVRLGPEDVQRDPQILADVSHHPARLSCDHPGR